MAAPDRETVVRILERTMLAAGLIVRPTIPSKTLQRSLQIQISRPQLIGRMYLPQFWSLYVHDGRGSITAGSRDLIFYPNPKEDPRHYGNYPTRVAQIKKLSEEDYKRDRKDGKLVKTQRVGPVEPNRFFEGRNQKAITDTHNEIAETEVTRTLELLDRELSRTRLPKISL